LIKNSIENEITSNTTAIAVASPYANSSRRATMRIREAGDQRREQGRQDHGVKRLEARRPE
jgi:hypothetical protein